MELSYEKILIIIASFIIGWFISYIKSRFEIRKYKKEMKGFEEHLNRQMKISSEGQKSLELTLDKLRKDNENLRVSVNTLGQKPGRAEIRLLNIYDGALRKMTLTAPGFASAWEASLQEAEKEYEDNEQGFKSIVKKIFSPSLAHSSEPIKQEENVYNKSEK
jgi:hypothetical protein